MEVGLGFTGKVARASSEILMARRSLKSLHRGYAGSLPCRTIYIAARIVLSSTGNVNQGIVLYINDRPVSADRPTVTVHVFVRYGTPILVGLNVRASPYGDSYLWNAAMVRPLWMDLNTCPVLVI